MKVKQLLVTSIFCFSIIGTSLMVTALDTPTYAQESHTDVGEIVFDGEYEAGIFDPEKPGNKVDPGPTPNTTGDLRIDFVPKLSFGKNKISKKDTVYPANAQLFLGDTGPRGNFIQVSDYRPNRSGWSLQVRQETQFKNNNTLNNELKGAMISFDKSWVNSTRDLSQAPSVSKDIIKIDNIGETYNLAEAKNNVGKGTWSIEFGASEENSNAMPNTLSPAIGPDGKPLLDPNFENKPIYQNSAVTLSIPGATKIDPVPYQTVLTWIISELP